VKAWFFNLHLVRKSKPSKGNPGQADTEFLQRAAARDGLSQAFRQFIECIIHNFPFPFWCPVMVFLRSASAAGTFVGTVAAVGRASGK
jgi:hypothetical protein